MTKKNTSNPPSRVEFTSRADWLKQRQHRITATDIARAMTGGPSVWRQIKKEKSQPPRDFTTKVFAWGHEREPVIIEYLQCFYDSSLESNEALWISGEDTRWAATPDAIGDTCLGECKTTKFLWPTLEDVEKKYPIQCRWQMMVMGKPRTYLAIERHEDYVPKETRVFEITRDREFEAKMIEVAEELLEFINSDDEEDADDDLEWLEEWRAKWEVAERLEEDAKAAKESLKKQIRARGDSFSHDFDDGFKITTFMPSARESFDSKAFKADNPDIYKQYVKKGKAPTAPVVRVTVPKKKEAAK